MTEENNKSFAEKNEERVKETVDKISDALTDDDKKRQESSSKGTEKK